MQRPTVSSSQGLRSTAKPSQLSTQLPLACRWASMSLYLHIDGFLYDGRALEAIQTLSRPFHIGAQARPSC